MKRLLPIVIETVRTYESNNPETILRSRGVHIRHHDMTFMPDAFYVSIGIIKTVSVKDTLNQDEKNIALAHELGHIVLRHKGQSLVDFHKITTKERDERELAANKFAFLLLAHTCLRNNATMIDSIRDEKLLSLKDTVDLLKQLEGAACAYR